jgi:hypothetical protein
VIIDQAPEVEVGEDVAVEHQKFHPGLFFHVLDAPASPGRSRSQVTLRPKSAISEI